MPAFSLERLYVRAKCGFTCWGTDHVADRKAALAARSAWLGIILMLAMSLSLTCAAQQAVPPATSPDVPQAPAAPPTKEAGAKLFAESGCAQCHGPVGNGTDKAPNIHDVRARKTDEQIYLQIKEGKGAMPAFGDALSEGEIRSIVAFLRASDGWALLPSPAK